MSILIQGMEMPNDGVEWDCFVRITSDTVELYDPTGESESVFYKAIELPPHGRLIDADDLVGQWTAPPEFYPNDYAVGVYDNGKLRVKDFRASVIDAPTVIDAEVQDA